MSSDQEPKNFFLNESHTTHTKKGRITRKDYEKLVAEISSLKHQLRTTSDQAHKSAVLKQEYEETKKRIVRLETFLPGVMERVERLYRQNLLQQEEIVQYHKLAEHWRGRAEFYLKQIISRGKKRAEGNPAYAAIRNAFIDGVVTPKDQELKLDLLTTDPEVTLFELVQAADEFGLRIKTDLTEKAGRSIESKIDLEQSQKEYEKAMQSKYPQAKSHPSQG